MRPSLFVLHTHTQAVGRRSWLHPTVLTAGARRVQLTCRTPMPANQFCVLYRAADKRAASRETQFDPLRWRPLFAGRRLSNFRSLARPPDRSIEPNPRSPKSWPISRACVRSPRARQIKRPIGLICIHRTVFACPSCCID